MYLTVAAKIIMVKYSKYPVKCQSHLIAGKLIKGTLTKGLGEGGLMPIVIGNFNHFLVESISNGLAMTILKKLS